VFSSLVIGGRIRSTQPLRILEILANMTILRVELSQISKNTDTTFGL
jgi:hypothetical protein